MADFNLEAMSLKELLPMICSSVNFDRFMVRSSR